MLEDIHNAVPEMATGKEAYVAGLPERCEQSRDEALRKNLIVRTTKQWFVGTWEQDVHCWSTEKMRAVIQPVRWLVSGLAGAGLL